MKQFSVIIVHISVLFFRGASKYHGGYYEWFPRSALIHVYVIRLINPSEKVGDDIQHLGHFLGVFIAF